MHPQMDVAEIGLLAIFIVIFLGMLTLAVFLWQRKFIIDGNKIIVDFETFDYLLIMLSK